jgi:hypothetical protein
MQNRLYYNLKSYKMAARLASVSNANAHLLDRCVQSSKWSMLRFAF